MAAPVAVVRAAPVGIYLKDGWQSFFAFSHDLDISLWEVEFTPLGVDIGESIDATTMHNDEWEQVSPPGAHSNTKLKKSEEMPMICCYDPSVYSQILAVIGREGVITQTFPDNSTVTFFGYIRSFKPQSLKKKELPLSDVIIVPTHYDYINRVEAGPVFSLVSGT